MVASPETQLGFHTRGTPHVPRNKALAILVKGCAQLSRFRKTVSLQTTLPDPSAAELFDVLHSLYGVRGALRYFDGSWRCIFCDGTNTHHADCFGRDLSAFAKSEPVEVGGKRLPVGKAVTTKQGRRRIERLTSTLRSAVEHLAALDPIRKTSTEVTDDDRRCVFCLRNDAYRDRHWLRQAA